MTTWGLYVIISVIFRLINRGRVHDGGTDRAYAYAGLTISFDGHCGDLTRLVWTSGGPPSEVD